MFFINWGAHAFYSPDCDFVERLGTHFSQEIRLELDKTIKGKEYRINQFQTLVLRGVRSVDFDGCTTKIWIKVKLKRQIFGTARGRMLLEGKVNEFSRSNICLNKIKVTKVRLSNSSDIGREVYRTIANEALPNKKCFEIN